MDDQKIKKIAADALRNKSTLYRYLAYFLPEDIERGILKISEGFLNNEAKPFLLKQASPYLTDFHFMCSGSDSGSTVLKEKPGIIFLDLEFSLKQLGKIRANYVISVSEMSFSPCRGESGGDRRIALFYRESLKTSNPLQSMALKAFLGDRTLLMKAAQLTGLAEKGRGPAGAGSETGWDSAPPIQVDRQSASLDVSRLPFVLPAFLDCVTVEYERASNGNLWFRFSFV